MLGTKFAILIGQFTFLILTVCYMEGMFWYLLCDVIRDFSGKHEEEDKSNYILYFELDKNSSHKNIIT
jgi:hypothetical protein